MKKFLIMFTISGALAVMLLIMFLTGVIDFSNTGNTALIEGNRLFAAAKYEEAVKAYAGGLQAKPQDIRLNYNSGQASYLKKDYQKAMEFYTKAPERVEKYLNAGNSILKLGDAATDPTQKQQFYQQALEVYKQGILKFPQNVALKYNYEYVKNKIEQQQNNENQNQQDNQENKDKQDNQDKNQDNQGQDNKQEGDNQDNKQDGDKQDNKQDNKQDGNKKDNQQNGQSSQSEKDKQQDKSQDQKQNQGQNQGQKQDQQSKDQAKNQNGSSLKESDSDKSGQTDEQVQYVLDVLEKQEEESLKNNQEVRDSGKGEAHDW